MRRIIINADDYAMDAAVDAAVLSLAAKGVVSAASAMVLSPRWREAALALRDAPLSKGLHLDLTSPFARSNPAGSFLPTLLLRAHAGWTNAASLRETIDRQLDLFEAGLGTSPDFVDGHQHVHHFPGVRDALLERLAARYGRAAASIGLRVCIPRRWRGAKAAAIAATGAQAFARLAAKRSLSTNSDFAGVYSFDADADLVTLWHGWLFDLAGPLPLVMCHVAASLDGAACPDPIRAARVREYRWLSSAAFGEALSTHSRSTATWPRA
jgi:predicted glycoside hydrolase/deacetylase ChbG (UPF0249 family)